MLSKSTLLLSLLLDIVCGDKLLHLQLLYRHGDRAPEGTYRNDPYQESAWPVPWGELTNDGMEQHFSQGMKIRSRYTDQLQFLPEKYNAKHLHVRSTDVDRTLMSAYSNLAGLYYDSKDTHPNSNAWPNNWSPVPVHTVAHDTDHLLVADHKCLRMDELEAEQVAHGKFIQYISAQLPLLMEISVKSGEKITEVKGLRNFFDAVTIEKVHNMTLPAWITDSLYNQVKTVVEVCEDYIFGSAGFDKPENTELIMLKGGLLLQEMIGNMDTAVSDKGADPKLHMYSAHDTTVAAFLRTLGAKDGIMGGASPDFAATVAMELWQDDDNSQYIKMMYSDNAVSPFRDVTSDIAGCGSAKCPLAKFTQRSQPYLPGDIIKKCDKL